MSKQTTTQKVPYYVTRSVHERIREAQKVQDREQLLHKQYEQLEDVSQHYPGPQIMGALILISVLALLISLGFGVVSLSVIYMPAVIFNSITIIVLRQITNMEYESYWRRFCLIWCFINSHLLAVLSVVPVISTGFAVAYRFDQRDGVQSEKMNQLTHLFVHYLAGDVCILLLAIVCTVYSMLTCLLCYATRGPIYSSYALIDLSKLDVI